ncbi:MAG TPA: site-2 protease family protein [Nitriliruptorales bacterium]
MNISAQTVIFIAVVIPSIILHEVSHGWVAKLFGDRTAEAAGRLTLNPIAHIDPFGTVILPIMLAVLGGPPFGYAKPVPVNPGNMRDPRNHGMLTSLAGPAVNIVLAVAAALVISTIGIEGVFAPGAPLWADALVSFGIVNVVLAAFNLLPVPPLDGSAVVERFLPLSFLPTWHRFRQYSMLLVFALIFLIPGALQTVFTWAIELWATLII